ncbi:MAG: hypothetical protein IKT67_06380 [Lachnospiraceae bacterium]|nr:hypothetical protein [Lachnospiraceae bacterium]
MNKKKNEQCVEKFLNFAEELSWLLDNYKGLKIEETVMQIREGLNNEGTSVWGNDLIVRKSTRSLVGIFPELFQNKVLFPSNQAIIEFANEVLQMRINPSKNRSKTEIIGEIVCTTYILTEAEIEKVVNALNKMVDNENVVKKVKEMKRNSTFSWNEIIQKLAE